MTYADILRYYADEDRFTSKVATGTLLRVAELLERMADELGDESEALAEFLSPPTRG